MSLLDGISIEYMPIDQPPSDPDNPKDHDLGALTESFERFGFISPGILNEETGLLIVGHGRRDKLLEMYGRGEDPPDRVRVVDGVWLWPVIRGISLSDVDGKAYIIADNRHTELGGWNEPSLVQNLQELFLCEQSLKGTGFDVDDMQQMIDLLDPEFPEYDETIADEVIWTECPKCGHRFIE